MQESLVFSCAKIFSLVPLLFVAVKDRFLLNYLSLFVYLCKYVHNHIYVKNVNMAKQLYIAKYIIYSKNIEICLSKLYIGTYYVSTHKIESYS